MFWHRSSVFRGGVTSGWKSKLLASISLLLVSKSDFLVSISLLLIGKSDFLVSISLFLVSKSDFLVAELASFSEDLSPVRRTPAWPSATVRRPPHSNYECDIDSSCLRAHPKLP